MFTILYTPTCMDFVEKLSQRIGETNNLSIDAILKDPTILGDFDNLGLVFGSEGKIVPADIEDLILDVLASHPSIKKVKYVFSFCITNGRTDFGLKVVEKLCSKIGCPTDLNLTFPARTRNDIDLDRAAYHINSRHYRIAGSNIATSYYMTKYGVLTGKLREGKRKIVEPHIDVFERSRRLIKWSIGLPILIALFLLVPILMVLLVNKGVLSLGMHLNVYNYSVLLIFSFLVVKYYLKFPFRRMFTEKRRFGTRHLVVGFIPMFIICIATNLIWMAFRSESFTLTIGNMRWLDSFYTLVTMLLQTMVEVVVCVSYITFLRNDTMPKRKWERFLCCILAAALFAAFHGRSLYPVISHFIIGFAMMAISLRTNGTEAAFGMRLAEKLVTSFLFTYKGAPFVTNAVFTQADKIGPMLVVQIAFCYAVAIYGVVFFSRRRTVK